MKTAIAKTFSDDPAGPAEVWVWPRRPPGWFGFSLTVHPWVFRRDGSGWSDTSDREGFVRQFVAGLRQRDPARIWHHLHVQLAGREPVLVSDRSKLGWLVRRLAGEWFEEAGFGLVAEADGSVVTVEDAMGFDPWEAVEG